MFRFALDKPTIPLVGLAIISLLGLSALFQVPIQLIPDLDPRVISVKTIWPGASPQDVEKEILIEQEEFLRSISGLQRMIGVASFGEGTVELEFPFGMDINEALIRTANALAQVPGYPENVDDPQITTDSMSQNAFAYYRISPLPDNPGGIVVTEETEWFEDNIAAYIERVPGVSSVEISGGTKKQVHVFLDPARLAAFGLSVAEVRRAIRARNRDMSGGDLDFGKRRYLVRTLGRFETVDDVNALIVTERNGAFIRISDIGHAEVAPSEQRALRYMGGERGLMMRVTKQVGANIVEVFRGIQQAIAELNEGTAREFGVRITENTNDVRYIEQSIRAVVQNLLIGALLATLVLRLFLKSWSATLIGAVGIPFCTLAAFLGLAMTGRTINVFSMAGVAFAIGMTLDNSIVVLENITRLMGKGRARAEAALEGVREVWPAVLASTLTTVMVFLPIVFLELEAGQLYSDIAVAISAMILMSMLVAIAFIPTAAGRLLTHEGPDDPDAHTGQTSITALGRRIGAAILACTRWLLATVHRRLTALAVAAAAAVAVIAWLTPAGEYLPEGEEAKIFARLFAPPGYNLATMEEVRQEIDPLFLPQLGADSEGFDSGATAIPPLIGHLSFVSPGQILFVMEPVSGRYTDALTRAATDVFRDIPGMRSFTSRGSIFSDNRGGSRSINVELAGRNLEQLFETALKVFVAADDLFDGGQVNSTPSPTALSMSQPIAVLRPDWERVAELGISQEELGYALWAFSDGAFVDEFYLDDDKLDMFLFSARGSVTKPADLEKTMISTPRGTVQLSSLARLEERVGTASVQRINGMRNVTLNIIPPRSVALETGVETVRRDLIAALRNSGVLPADISVTITGASTALDETREEMQWNFLLALAIAYLLMVAVFSHWGYPLIIMTTVPLGISGGLVGLWLLNRVGENFDLLGLPTFSQPFDVITMLGFLVLIGTVVNNPILIVERTRSNMSVLGMAAAEAVREATRVRLRPVMMSTITTVFGLSPLVLIPGPGTELYRGLGAIVLFGLLFSSLVTLTVLPVLLTQVLQLRERFRSADAASGP